MTGSDRWNGRGRSRGSALFRSIYRYQSYREVS